WENIARLPRFGVSPPPGVKISPQLAAASPELASAPARNKAVANHPCKGLWFITTRGWVITWRFTSVVSLIIPLSQSRLSHRGLLRSPRAATRGRRRLAFCIGMRETFVTPDHRRPLLECGAVPGAVAA